MVYPSLLTSALIDNACGGLEPRSEGGGEGGFHEDSGRSPGSTKPELKGVLFMSGYTVDLIANAACWTKACTSHPVIWQTLGLESRSLFENCPPHADIDIAVDGGEAIAAYSSALHSGKPYELICLDIIMPKVDGAAVLNHVRRTEKAMRLGDNGKTKILMTTSVSDREKILNIFKSGCDGYMHKPYKRDRLDEELKQLGLIGFPPS